ncbi:hypothetical protein Goklo_012985, partial [Gossypium klotzschianum]|nr:hypothetical protein [Gossypium klotzschianum]
ILRVTTLLGNASVLGQSGLEQASPLASGGIFSNGGADMNGWTSRFQSEMSCLVRPSSAQNWVGSQGSSSGLIVKRTIRVDIPVDSYPNYNFVGRLLGPRGNSLKRVEANTECRVLIRGRGSIKDPTRVTIILFVSFLVVTCSLSKSESETHETCSCYTLLQLKRWMDKLQ